MQQATPQNTTTFSLGAHLITPRRWYVHHGIYVGDDKVVHYQGYSRSGRKSSVAVVSLEGFSRGEPVHLCTDGRAAYSSLEIVDRAMSRIGEDAYDILSNNCEHFCLWCLAGSAQSRQVKALTSVERMAAHVVQSFMGLIYGYFV